MTKHCAALQRDGEQKRDRGGEGVVGKNDNDDDDDGDDDDDDNDDGDGRKYSWIWKYLPRTEMQPKWPLCLVRQRFDCKACISYDLYHFRL